MILTVIPARGGSKGIPGKNIKDLYGQPLISYTIQAALDCKKIDRVVVSTDSEEIACVAKKYGADVPFLRPAALAMDTSKTIDAGDWYGWRISAVTARRKYYPQTGYERNLPSKWCSVCKLCSRLDKGYQF